MVRIYAPVGDQKPIVAWFQQFFSRPASILFPYGCVWNTSRFTSKRGNCLHSLEIRSWLLLGVVSFQLLSIVDLVDFWPDLFLVFVLFLFVCFCSPLCPSPEYHEWTFETGLSDPGCFAQQWLTESQSHCKWGAVELWVPAWEKLWSSPYLPSPCALVWEMMVLSAEL